MSQIFKPIKIALIAEGPTDLVLIKAAVKSILNHGSVVVTMIQPESRDNENIRSYDRPGWTGIREWIEKHSEDGNIYGDMLFDIYDLLIIYIDFDVARERSVSVFREELSTCENIGALQRFILDKWANVEDISEQLLFCIPCQNTESWVLVALGADEDIEDIEAFKKPEVKLLQKQRRFSEDEFVRLKKDTRSGKKKIKKLPSTYEKYEGVFREKWPTISKKCIAANIFENNFRNFLFNFN